MIFNIENNRLRVNIIKIWYQFHKILYKKDTLTIKSNRWCKIINSWDFCTIFYSPWTFQILEFI